MRHIYLYTFILNIVITVTMNAQNRNMLPPKIVIDQYHGQNIEDPYRYVEDLSNPEVKNWLTTQNEVAQSFLNNIEKRQSLINKQIELDTRDEFVISKLKISRDEYHFYLKRLPHENVAKLYYKTSFTNEEHLLYDPTIFKPSEKKKFVINYFQPDWKNSNIAISLTEKGKEISQMIILNIQTKKIYPEILDKTWPSDMKGINWLPDNSGFTYVHFPNVNDPSKNFLLNSVSLLHRIGESQALDTPIFSRALCTSLNIKEKDFPITSIENQSSKYLIGAIAGAESYYDTYYSSIKTIESNSWTLLFSKQELIKSYTIIGDSIIFKTAYNAPNFKIGITSIQNPDFKTARIIIPEKKDQVITDFAITSEGLYYITNKNGVQAKLYKHTPQKDEEIVLPKAYGTIEIHSLGNTYHKFWITAKGWTTDTMRYEYSQDTLVLRNINNTVNSNILKDIVIEEIEVTGHDGQQIPLSIFYHKDMVKNGKNRVLMDGYGSYGISMKLSMRIHRTLWLLEGGIYAIAHVRGGGEKGINWHKGGYKASKPNTWKDFISCAEYLISDQYTSSKKLAILSGSAGGILIGRAITERPDLFAAAIIEFGTVNMLRFETHNNGANNTKEFGSVKDPEEFKSLLEMDAYHHIEKNEKYPAVFLTAGLNDPRVPAWFSAKFIAKLQAYDESNNPKLLLVDPESGHGIDDTKTKIFERYANIVAFAFKQTGHPDYQF
ncbi:prolyl oligopeptidase family serine peptidase [Dokdonia sp.]|uniref:prolyl oligopeptidase family serine peptidase n=1 Tax=Dokdonia sp. TaxID=2024995 RepID=UPI00326683B1